MQQGESTLKDQRGDRQGHFKTWLLRWAVFVRRHVVILPLMVLLVFALPQLFGGRMRVDSGLYSGVSLHAYNNGTFWTLMAGDQPYFRKPPLVFWIHGAFFKLLGAELWVMRLPNILAAMGCVAMTAIIGKQLAGWRVGMVAGAIFATNIPFLRFLKRFILDYWHTLLVLVAVWLVIEAARRPRAWLIVLAGVPIGLAMIVKPVIAVVSLPILAGWLLWIGRTRLALWALPAIAIALIIAAPWHLSMIQIHGDTFINEYFRKQMANRAAGGEGFNNEPWYWYFMHLGKEYWPWMIPLLLGIWMWIRSEPGGKSTMADRSIRTSGTPMPQESWLMSLCLWWSLAWIVIVSLSADKHDRYIMQILPMLGMIAALWLARWSPFKLRRGLIRWLTIAAPVALAGSIIVAMLPWDYNRPEDPEWVALRQFIRDHPNERYHMGTINYRDGGRIYFYTGIWPRNIIDARGARIDPQPGDLVLNSNMRKSKIDPGDEVIFDQGELQVVRKAP